VIPQHGGKSDSNIFAGNLRGGSDDIRKHKWFKGLDWEAVLRCEIQAPIIPELRHPADTHNFEMSLSVRQL
jgi:hypothetical protein